MAGTHRPLSPHLQIYRWQVSNTLSILHRITGVVLALGALALVAWLLALATGPDAYAGMRALAGSIPGRLFQLGWSFAFFYHLCNGIRHLGWDAGLGFEKGFARRTGWMAVGAALVLTVLFWLAAASAGSAP